MTMSTDEIQKHRLETPELEFLDRFPDAREGVVYEFDSESEAEAAKAVLVSTAFVAGKRGRVLRLPWKGHTRLVAVAHA